MIVSTPSSFPIALELPLDNAPSTKRISTELFASQLQCFCEFGKSTRELSTAYTRPDGVTSEVLTFVNEYWTARQRQAHSLHEISYRACFKPQLPRFFIERLTDPGDFVYDPFMGRGTTLLEAALLGRCPVGCDINPLSLALVRPRLRPPTPAEVQTRLSEIPFSTPQNAPEELLVFYHPETLQEICALREYLILRRQDGKFDPLDDWMALVGLNRLTGHSAGFFSVYTLPPNQAVSVKSQLRINERRKQVPPRRHVPGIILKKSRQLTKELTVEERRRLADVADRTLLLTAPAHATPTIATDSVQLVVTSPPFLNIVQYATDNWLRCWFLGIDVNSVKLTVPSRLDKWQETMTSVFHELARVVKPGGHVAFEVG